MSKNGFLSMTSDNPFTAFGETLAPDRKPRRQGVSTREATRREKALQERNRLSQAHRRWRKEAFNALLKGPHGAAAQTLIDFLDHMQSDGPELIAHVSAGPWRDADKDTRFLILVLVDAAVIRLRERAGLVPFDDPLHDEESNTFLTIRKLLQ
jgi:hypothetical protein